MKLTLLTIHLLVLVCVAGFPAQAQSVRSLVNGGNGLYKEEKYSDAEVSYRKALEKKPGLVQGHFNLGNSLYKQGKVDESVKEYQNALEKADDRQTKAHAYYNIGDSFLKAQNYQDAVKSYVESLKLAPNDRDAKYNLSYALAKLKEQQQQQQQQKSDKNQDKKEDQQKKDQQKQDQQQQKQDQQKADQQQKQQSQQDKRMSKADAERILDVLKNSEKDVQKKLRVRQATRPRPEKDW